jgi:hypothetical protein
MGVDSGIGLLLTTQQVDRLVRVLKATGETDILATILKQLPFKEGVVTKAPFSGANADVRDGKIVGWSGDL